MATIASSLPKLRSSKLLQLPPEIRLTLYTHLFHTTNGNNIKIDHEYPERQAEDLDDAATWLMRRAVPPEPSRGGGLSSQILRVCRQIHDEALPVLYQINRFDCSARDAVPLLLHNIGAANFTLIRHLLLDWEQLQEFAWALAKPQQRAAMAGLELIETATWRMRVLGGSSFLWRDVKAYERQICQAALEICEKHPRLSCVLQKTFYRTRRLVLLGRPATGGSTLREAAVGPPSATHRIKWRFVTDKAAASLDETEMVVDLHSELAALKSERFSQQAMDPI